MTTEAPSAEVLDQQDDEVSSLFVELDGITERAQELMAALDAERQELVDEHARVLAELDARREKILNVLRAFGSAPEPEPKPVRTPRRDREGPPRPPLTPSMNRITRMLDAITTPEFTALDVWATTGDISPKSTYGTFRWLETQGFIEVCGKVSASDGSNHLRKVYRFVQGQTKQTVLARLA